MSEAAADRVAIAPGQALLARMEDVQHHVARLHELLRETYLPAALEARAATHAVETLAELVALAEVVAMGVGVDHE